MNMQAANQSDRRSSSGFSWLVCVVAGLLVMGSAQAQWKVVDEQGNRKLDTIKDRLGDGNVNKNLKDLYNQQRIGGYDSAGKIAEDPEEKLDADKPMGLVLTDIGVTDRCPASKATLLPGAAQTQWQICKLLVQTELAQYKYSLKMYEVAKERHKQFVKIQQERENLKKPEEDQGKLQSNNNKLLALIALMEIDRQQQKTYMDAYDARTRYLIAARDTVSKTVLNGDPLKKLASGAIGYATLKIALKEAEANKKDWGSERR